MSYVDDFRKYSGDKMIHPSRRHGEEYIVTRVGDINRALLLLFIVFLAGCMRHYEIPHGLTPDKVTENESIVILSTGTKSPSSHSCRLMMRGIENLKLGWTVVVNNPTIESHFADHRGFLHVLKFKPGKYCLALQADQPFTWYGKPSSAIVFEVKEGELVYIGEVLVEDVKTPWILVGRVKLTINDKFEGDIGIFLEKNPSFKVEDIKKRIPYSIRVEDTENTKGQ
jgi:hypothetical protein